MKLTWMILAAAALVTGGMTLGGAHPAGYVNPNLCPGALFTQGFPLLGIQGCISSTNCDNDVGKDLFLEETGVANPGIGRSIGAVNFCGTDTLTPHLVPNQDGQVSVEIIDDILGPIGGTYCQDLNADGICGGRDPLAPAGLYNEPRVYFCAVATLETPLVAGSKTTAQWAAGGNWDPAKNALVWPDAVGDGIFLRGTLPSDPINNPGPIPPSPSGNTCGNTYDGGHLGRIVHS